MSGVLSDGSAFGSVFRRVLGSTYRRLLFWYSFTDYRLSGMHRYLLHLRYWQVKQKKCSCFSKYQSTSHLLWEVKSNDWVLVRNINMIYSDNWTEWSPNGVFDQSEFRFAVIDFFITLMITDQNGRHDILLPIDLNHYNFREEQNNLLEKIYPLEIFSKPIKYPKFWNSAVLLRNWLLLWKLLSILCLVELVWLAASTVWLQVSDYSPTVRSHYPNWGIFLLYTLSLDFVMT